MKYLITGLGNPGAKYEHTRHNIGFDVLDALAVASNAVFREVRHGWGCEIGHKGRRLVLLKPNTFMNLSGKAVAYWMQQERIPLENLLVITDDLSLPVGAIRLRGKGSDGGHNGLKSVQEKLGTHKYPRLRFGIGDDFSSGQQVDYVLGTWPEDQKVLVRQKMLVAADAVLSFTFAGLANTMNAFNGK